MPVNKNSKILNRKIARDCHAALPLGKWLPAFIKRAGRLFPVFLMKIGDCPQFLFLNFQAIKAYPLRLNDKEAENVTRILSFFSSSLIGMLLHG